MEQAQDWQNSCKDIKSRNTYLLQNDVFTDCRFLVGIEPNQEYVCKHKVMLAGASPVFQTMFFGNIPDKSDPILIPDVYPDIFRTMIEYIYTDNINFTTFDKAIELYYVAKKYMLTYLIEECTTYLYTNMTPKNACVCFKFGKLYQEPRILDKSNEYIMTKTREVLCEPNIDLNMLVYIFSRPKLAINSELELFEVLQNYVDKNEFFNKHSEPKEEITLVITGQEQEGTNKTEVEDVINQEELKKKAHRSVLFEDTFFEYDPDNKEHMMIKEALKKIHFLALTPQQFAAGPARSKLFSHSELVSLFINISNPNIADCPLPEGFSSGRRI